VGKIIPTAPFETSGSYVIRNKTVVELFEKLACSEITVSEFILVAERFSDEELRQLCNILHAIGYARYASTTFSALPAAR